MKKILIALSIVFTLMLLAQTMTVKAFFHPGPTPTDDRKMLKYGPLVDAVLCPVYGGTEEEFLAFKAKEIDVMDWPLIAPQVEELNIMDPNQETYARAFFVDRGCREFDLNDMRFPTSDVNFRKAMAHMFNKDNFIATQLAGLALKMDSYLSWSPSWVNPYCTDLYPRNLETAASILKANGYTDKDADGFIEGPGGEEIAIVFYARMEDPDRSAMGQLMAQTMEVEMAATSLGAGIDVDLHMAPKSECFQKCMVEFDYHVYTGGWSFGRDPTTLYDLFLGTEAQAYPYTANYPGYNNPEFDVHAVAFLTAASIGVAKENVFEMQKLVADDVATIPVFTYASYAGALADLENLVNMDGVGFGQQGTLYTLYNTYREGDNTLRWGFMNDIETMNVLHSEWVWDWQIAGTLYLTLIDYSPYDVTEDYGELALSWNLGEWNNQGETASYLEFKIRQDVYWHDVPPKADRQTPGGQSLLPNGATNVQLTAEDVAYSILLTRNIEDSWNQELVNNVLYAEVLDPFTVRFYMDVFMPLWALHRVGGTPIFPKHVWEKVGTEGQTREFDPNAQQAAAGNGAFYFDYAGSSAHEYYKMTTYERWYRYHPVDLYGVLNKPINRVAPGAPIVTSFYLKSRDSMRTIEANSMDISVELKYPNGTKETVYTGKNPALTYDAETWIFNYTGTPGIGKYELKATISPDPVTGHADIDGYTVNIWSTIAEDLNLDFKVNILDISTAAKAFGTTPTHARWDPKADIDHNFAVNIVDISKIALKFGWP